MSGGPILGVAIIEALFALGELLRLQMQMQQQGGDASQEQVDASQAKAHDASQGWDAAANPNDPTETPNEHH